MRLFMDNDGKVNFDAIFRDTTVNDLLNGVDEFLGSNIQSCEKCRESCCTKPWSFGFDNVCVKRLAGKNSEAVSSFVKENLIPKENIIKEFDQFVLDKHRKCHYITEANRCRIYDKRPIICRLYTCIPKSNRYNLIREITGAVFLEALVIEEEIKSEDESKQHFVNPAVNAEDYNILLSDIIEYACETGWLDSKEVQELKDVWTVHD